MQPDQSRTNPDQQSLFPQFLERLDGVFWEADPATFNFTFLSGQEDKLLGYSRENWFEDNFWVNHLHPEDRDWASQFCMEATRSLENHNFDYRMLAADGRTVWIHARVTVISRDGKIEKVCGLLLDITNQKMEAVGRLVGGIAHDFNNLLTVIISYSELLLLSLQDGDPQRHQVNEIFKCGQRATGLTKQLLAFGRKQELQPKSSAPVGSATVGSAKGEHLELPNFGSVRGKETILLVEDEETVRVLCSRVLESCGYSVLNAKDGVEALEWLQSEASKIDLLITDVVMPRLSGPKLVEAIKRDLPLLPVIFISGYADEIVLLEIPDEKRDLLRKPFNPKQLTERVRAALAASKLVRNG